MRQSFNFRINRYGNETQIVFFSKPMLRGSFDYEDNQQNSFDNQQPIAVDQQSLSDTSIYQAQVRGYNNQYRSYIRSKQMLYDYARSNDWEWFCTFTTSHNILKYKGINRYDEKTVLQSIMRFFKNFKYRYANDLKYVLIPELHEDGAVHLHGLFSGIPKEEVTRVKGGIYALDRYEKAFGYSNLQRVKNSKRVSSYITKYITKDLWSGRTCQAEPDPDAGECPWGKSVPDLPEDYLKKAAFYKHKYYVSEGLKKSDPEYYSFDGGLAEFIKQYFPEASVQHCKSVPFGDEFINYIQLKEDSDENEGLTE